MADDEHDDHEHPNVVFATSDVDEVTLGNLRLLHPALADTLLFCRRFATLSDEEKRLLADAQKHVESYELWTPGYHAPGDLCAACGSPVTVLFSDRFGADGRAKLDYAPFVADVPVHARKECLDAIAAKLGPRRAPQVIDRLRREHTTVRDRPTARVTQFFRHDALTHPPFALEDWANSVAEANAGKLDRAAARDLEKLLSWAHARLFH